MSIISLPPSLINSQKSCFFLVFACLCASLIVPQSWGSVFLEGDLTHQFLVKPGENREGTVVITNNSNEISEVKLEQTDYLFFANGKNEFGPPGNIERSNANWIKFSRSQISVLPNESVSVSYTLDVPKDEQLSGTYWSVLMVEPIIAPPSVEGSEDQVKVSVGQLLRYAVQIVTHVGDEGVYKLRFADKRLEKQDDGKVMFILDIENIGDHWLVPEVWIEVFNASGSFMGRFSSSKKRIFPGTSVRHEFDFTQLPAGTYKALVVADNADEHVFGAQYTLEM